MYIKWRNIFFWFLALFLFIAVVIQGNTLITNIKESKAIVQNENTNVIKNKNAINETSRGDNERSLKINETINKFSDNNIGDIFLKNALKKTIPMMELGYKVQGEVKKNYLLSFFSVTTKINLKDPKTLLGSQIPMLESYEVDDVDITVKDQMAIHDEIGQKPMNDDQAIDTSASKTNLDKKDPLVLIYHTHTTESFTSSSDTKIDYISPWKTLDKENNMAKIGKEMKSILEDEYGIKVIHDTTIHDYPSYDGSYGRSLKTIEKILSENPSIKYVFDIHRDGFKDTKKNRENCVTVFGQQEIAKVMPVLGNDNFNSKQNLKFAQRIHKELDDEYPGIVKSISSRDNRKYNQFVSDYAALLEVGSNLNTVEETIETSKYLASTLGKIILELEK